MADFLREIREISALRHRQEEISESSEQRRVDEKLPDITLSHSERALFIPEDDVTHDHDGELSEQKSEKDNRGTGGGVVISLCIYLYSRVVAWMPGQGVRIHFPAIIEILIQQLDGQR